MSKSKLTGGELAKIAAEMRKVLELKKQNELFRCAAEAGYLASLADGDVDAKEKEILVEGLHALSNGLIVEWEVDAFIDECNEAIGAEGHQARAQAVGQKLAELGQAEAGVLVASCVALATGGIDKKEAVMLERIGTAAGLEKRKVGELVKKARDAMA